jgi:murein DD-endopeptidase MepM/ murein hydrolase activator NlpD
MRLRLLAAAVAAASLAACAAPAPVAPPARPAPPPVRPAPPALAPTFEGNLGRLPWPSAGTVTGRFGRRTDPASGTTTDAVGVDLATPPSAEVRAVFDGTVARVGVMAAYGTYVMVQHGGFTTVYGNLSGITVGAGDAVRTGEPVGFAGTQDALRGAGLFFAVFRGGTPEDPLPWLRPTPG